MNNTNVKKEKRIRRHTRIRVRISGKSSMPRLSVFKSNRYISAQLIDDSTATTIVSAHSKNAKGKTLLEKSANLGKDIAAQAKAKKISKIVFDRGGFKYVGCVKAIADGAREGGLTF